MSIEAISWALNSAQIPTDRRDASTLASVLIGLANHADPDGRNAFPSVARLVRYTRLAERTVRSALHTLEELGLITPSDPGVLAAHIKRADRRPKGWDLDLAATAAPAPTAGATATRADQAVHTDVHTDVHSAVHSTVHSSTDGVQPLHPAPGHGVQTESHGVQTTTSRGATTAPEPSKNHPLNRPTPAPARAPARTAPSATPAAASAPQSGPQSVSRSSLPPPCGQCDARPGEPVNARIEWLDTDRHRSRPCPRCHPSSLPHRSTPAAALVNASTPPRDTPTAAPGRRHESRARATPAPPRGHPIDKSGTTGSPANASAHRGDHQ